MIKVIVTSWREMRSTIQFISRVTFLQTEARVDLRSNSVTCHLMGAIGLYGTIR